MKKFTPEIEIDCFAGGGGSSCGARLATGRSPRFALNHNEDAIKMHKANHPRTHHVLEDIWRKNPKVVCGDNSIGLALFSPDCRHFSLARGGRPTSPRVRSLAWSVVWYAKNVKPRIIIVENVREFLSWGSLLPDGRPNPAKKGKTFRAWMCALRREKYRVEYRVLNAADYGVPTHRRRLFIIARRDGEPIVWPDQTHADPKLIEERPLVFSGLTPYRTAAECIDFTLPTRSIFERKKDLAEKTQRRIAKGFMRFVVENPKPYIVRLGQTGGNGSYASNPDDPLTTVTTKAEHCIVTPTLVKVNHGGDDDRSASVEKPINGVTSKHGYGLAAASLVEMAYGDDGRRGDGCKDIQKPLGVVHAGGNNHADQETHLAPVYLSEFYGQSVGAVTDAPLPSATSQNKHAKVAVFLSRFFGGPRQPVGKEVDRPLPTVTQVDHHAIVGVSVVGVSVVGVGGRSGQTAPTGISNPTCAITTKNDKAVVAASLVKFRGESSGSDAQEPCPTITSGQGAARPAGAAHALGMAAVYLARFNHGDKQWNGVDEPLGVVTTQGNKFAVVYAWLMKYHGTSIGSPLDEPAHTVDGNDRYALLKVFVETSPGVREPAIMLNVPGVGPCLVADIHLRMLTPRELARCQGFSESYKLTGSKANQVARIGNSVPPPLVEALVRANYKPVKRQAVADRS